MERSLSALMAVRNAESTLRRAVLEMLDILPELTSRFELVVIDDCSSDATIEVADELAARYPQLLAVRHPVPRGRPTALATGLDRSIGEAVFVADEDCRLPLDALGQLWAALGEHELALGCPSGRDSRPGEPYRGDLGGGYQMGSRRLFRQLAHALADQATLIAELQRHGLSWHEERITSIMPRKRHIFLPPAISGVPAGPGTRPDRSMRADPPAADRARPKHPSYSEHFRRLAAEE